MDQLQLALLGLLVGAVVGGGIVLTIFLAIRLRERAIARASDDIPEGVADVLSAMDDAALVTDASATVLAASAPAEIFGIRVGEVVPSEDVRALARASRESGVAVSETLRLHRGTLPADERLVAARATPISPRLTLVLVRDITEHERVEEMRRDFVANTSHELKTPVGAVSLLAEAIESAADDPRQVRVFADRLSGEASRLAALTSRIMSLSRLQASDELKEVRDVSVDEVVASAVDAHTLQADSAQVSIVRGGTKGLYVRGEAQVLSEAVGNLIANAIAYSPVGSNVGVGVKAVDDVVEIAVTDRGIGIPENEQSRVFERFYRADQARSRRTGGTGLGLAIVKHAVQRHGGEVRLWSRPGRGSTFTVRLPLATAPEHEPPRSKGRRGARKATASTASIKGETA